MSDRLAKVTSSLNEKIPDTAPHSLSKFEEETLDLIVEYIRIIEEGETPEDDFDFASGEKLEALSILADAIESREHPKDYEFLFIYRDDEVKYAGFPHVEIKEMLNLS